VTKALLDSDVIIWYLRGRNDARRWVEHLARDAVPCCSALSVTEIALGMRPKETAATRGFLDALCVVAVSREIAWRAGLLIRDYARVGTTLDFVDATIAATCLVHDLALATYNPRHYPMPGLRHARAPA
jgi:hypothetical protein